MPSIPRSFAYAKGMSSTFNHRKRSKNMTNPMIQPPSRPPRTPSRPRPNVSTTSESRAPLGAHLPGVTSLLHLQSTFPHEQDPPPFPLPFPYDGTTSPPLSSRTRDPEPDAPIIENVTVLTTDLLQASSTFVQKDKVWWRGSASASEKSPRLIVAPEGVLRGRGSLRRWEAGTCSERVGGCRRTVCSKKGR